MPLWPVVKLYPIVFFLVLFAFCLIINLNKFHSKFWLKTLFLSFLNFTLFLNTSIIWLYNKRCCYIACNPTFSNFYQTSFETILKCKIARIEKSTLTFFLFSRKTNHLFTVFFSFPVTFFYKRYLQRSNL